MPLDKRCLDCFKNTRDRILKKYFKDINGHQDIKLFYEMLIRNDKNISSPLMQKSLYNKLFEYTGIRDPFLEEKRLCNNVALKLYDEWKPQVMNAHSPFDLALRLAVAGNIMDYGALQHFSVEGNIHEILKTGFAIDHSKKLMDNISNSKRMLYIGDNAGEIVFDKLFIETLNHQGITFAVRGGSILNDVTLEDAEYVGIDKIVPVISSGYDVPAVCLDHSSKVFNDHFNAADLIIAKGQGNYESLFEMHDPRIYFLLVVKCDVIADMMKVKKGSYVVLNHLEKY